MASAKDVVIDPQVYSVNQDEYFHGLDSHGTVSFDRFMNQVFAPNTTAKMDEASERAYNQATLASARAYEQALDNTKYQRAVEDLKKAGLNPWLAVQNGLGGMTAGNVSGYQSTSNQTAKTSKGNNLFGVAALIKVLASLLG